MECRKCKCELPTGSIFCNYCGAKQELAKRIAKTKARGNGQGTVVKRGKTYTAVVTRYKGGNRDTAQEGGFKTRSEALQALPNLRDKLKTGGKKNKKLRRPETLRTLYEHWSTGPMLKLSKSRQTSYKIAWGRLDNIADEEIKELTIADLQDVIDDKTETFYPARDMKNLLSHLYKRARAQEEVRTNLSEFLVLPELDEKEGIPFSPEEIKIFWQHYEAGGLFPCYILLMIYSGMMPGELQRAEKGMIDWEQRTIFGCGIKTKERKRKPIVFPDFIVPVLQRICDSVEGEKLLNMCREDFYDHFKPTLKEWGCRELPPYSCRHTTGSALAMSEENIPAAAIQAVMRQRRFESTRKYIHPDVTDARNAVDKLKKQ